MSRLLTMFLAILIVAFAAASSLADEGCSTDKCHGEMGTAQYVHGPVGAGQCGICHQAKNPNHPSGAKGDFTLAQGGGVELCYGCHERKDANPVVHTAIKKSGCTGCHDPHQSDAELQLKEAITSDLCFTCHTNDKTNRQFVHGPVAAGDCNICHNPHSSTHEDLTEEKGAELCLLCHVDRQEEFQRKYVHGPVKDSCDKCHDAHSTDFTFMLYGEGEDLCVKCHKKVMDKIEGAAVKHTALERGTCTSCHTPHSSNFPRQLRNATKDICYSCHEEMGMRVKAAKAMHGPVQQNDCYACHDPHGSGYTKVLKKPFPPSFYMPYKTENYAMCFDCHNKDIALNEFTTKLTDFRNGDQNMHYLHVNKDPKGRSCKACHEVHAGSQEKHIRKEVPFGRNWKLPVNFTKTKNGGKCVVGCHKPKDYDRKNPVVY